MSNEIETGGAAFPMQFEDDGSQSGMTLRDYFAAKAMQGICANDACVPTRQVHFDNIAEDAYRMADSMLKARKIK